MEMQNIINYIKEQGGRVEMPLLQERFQLKYSETVRILSDLLQNRIVKYCDGFTYELNEQDLKSQESYASFSPSKEQQPMFIKALWECIKIGSAAPSLIQRKCSVGYVMAQKALDWMEENGFISSGYGSARKVQISREEFIARFGQPSDFEEDFDVERSHRENPSSLRCMDEDEEDEEDDEDEDEDIERREYLERRRQELLARLQQMTENDEEEEDSNKIDEIIQSKVEKMPDYNIADGTFSVAMSMSYPNGTPFRIKAVKHEGRWYLSDLGNTLEYLSLFNDKDALGEYFSNTLNNENMKFIESAVCTTLDDVQDLCGEVSFLFKVVNGLTAQKYFNAYYLEEELLTLANAITEEEDSALLGKTLLLLDETPVRVSMLQKKLHIGHTKAVAIIDTLTRLGVLSSARVKTERISKGFIAHVRYLLEKNEAD